jgi:type IV pilus assembly protein PilV
MKHLLKTSSQSQAKTQAGVTLIEVLVTMLILGIGLIGLVKLHSHLISSEVEAYQRSQALLLLSDMTNRISVNRNSAAQYVTDQNGLGAEINCPVGAETHKRDQREWCNALRGAAETAGGKQIGAMIGGRGCVESLPGGRYLITVAWQGTTPISVPAASLSCAKGLYDSTTATGKCKNDQCRRVVSTVVEIASL